MDIFTRSIRGWHLGQTLHQELSLTALQRALATGRRPEIHHSDQGVQYAASAYIDALQGTAISMAEVGKAWQNGFAERLIRTIKEEEVDLSDYHDYQDAFRQLGRFPSISPTMGSTPQRRRERPGLQAKPPRLFII